MVPLSILELAPIAEGLDASNALHNALRLAQAAERLGYKRFWVAEHHNLPGVASAATAVVLAYVGSGTATIRIGAGGIMLPNHAPLIIAEQFGTLEALFPRRVDLGLGRAPGSDQVTARALRRTLSSDPDEFPRDVLELMQYFAPDERQVVNAVPGAGLDIPIWILGSSLYGAQLAAAFGLPFAFASHFAPTHMMQAVEIYRSTFRRSAYIDAPYVMLGCNVFAADTTEEAELLMTSVQQAFVNLRFGAPGKLPPPVARYAERLDPMQRGMLEQLLQTSIAGTPEEVREWLDAFVAKTGADELIIAAQIYDFDARVKSYELIANACGRTSLRASS